MVIIPLLIAMKKVYILITKKQIKFLPSDIKSNYIGNIYHKEKTISSDFLNQVVKEDNQNN